MLNIVNVKVLNKKRRRKMGLYDWVFVKCECPNCGKMELREFQTKDLGCGFYEYEFGYEVGEIYHIEFLDFCSKCKCSIRAWGIIRNNKLVGIKIIEYSIQPKKEKKIFKSYHWYKEKKKMMKSK
jgi:hypothetical protein